MRIISGEYRGRKLKAVPGKHTRPTTDKVKESIFNMIGPYFNGGHCLDLFSGSGSLGIEAVSRGMERAVLVDKAAPAIQTIRDNVAMTKEPEKFEIMRSSANQAVNKLSETNQTFELVFLDPPYAKQQIVKQIELMLTKNLLTHGALIVCEVDKDIELPENVSSAYAIKNVVYGITRIVVYKLTLQTDGGKEDDD